MKWMLDHKADRPVGKYALAQAFAWRCREFLHRDGVCALLMPAMTLFEDPSHEFRKTFFRQHRIYSVPIFPTSRKTSLHAVPASRRLPSASGCVEKTNYQTT